MTDTDKLKNKINSESKSTSKSTSTPAKSKNKIKSDSSSNSDSKSNSKKSKLKTKSIFLDEDEESDDDIIYVANTCIVPNSNSNSNSNSIIKTNIVRPKTRITQSLLSYMFINANYYNFKSWDKCFPDGNVSLRSLVKNPEWDEFFDSVESKEYFKQIELELGNYIIKESKKTILPYAELTFNIFNILSPSKIKVIIIGQDPYISTNNIKNKEVPQATGFSFSVPLNYGKLPPSLVNIYNNLVKYGHMEKLPEHGSLTYWILQGCFLMNASFTTFRGLSNAHSKIWEKFTQDLLLYINNKCSNVVFLVWGKFAHNLCMNINANKHHLITSSHPSPYSVSNTFMGKKYITDKNNKNNDMLYPSFNDTDHFHLVNKYLESKSRDGILWNQIY